MEMKRTDPTAHFLKAVDVHTGYVVGQANWLILDKDPGGDRLEEGIWEDDHEMEYAQELFTQYMVPRTEAFRNANGPLIGETL